MLPASHRLELQRQRTYDPQCELVQLSESSFEADLIPLAAAAPHSSEGQVLPAASRYVPLEKPTLLVA